MRLQNAQLYHDKIHALYAKRCINYADKLPTVGLAVVDDLDEVIAAGFIEQVEGNYGLVSGYVTDPSASPEVRNHALNFLTQEIIALSEMYGMAGLLLFSTDPTIIRRASDFGFKIKPDVIMTRGEI